MKKFWNMTVSPLNNDVGSITMYGDISDVSWFGDEITPTLFKQDLDDMGDISELEIHINSGGGDVFAGFAIYNMIKRHKAHKTVYVDGLAASIASLIAMAGDTVVMPRNSMMMIHKAWSMVAGNADELRKMADTLEGIDAILCSSYEGKTGLGAEEIEEMLSNETWMSGEEAVEKGFADVLEEDVAIAASIDKKFLDRYHNVPETLNNRGESEPVEEILDTPVEDEQEIADAPNTLEEQRKDFNRIRKKIYERE